MFLTKILMSIAFPFTELFSALCLVPTRLRKTWIVFLDFPKTHLFPQGSLCNSQIYVRFGTMNSYYYILALQCPSIYHQGVVIVYFSAFQSLCLSLSLSLSGLSLSLYTYILFLLFFFLYPHTISTITNTQLVSSLLLCILPSSKSYT